MKISLQKGLVAKINALRPDLGEYCQVSYDPATGSVFGDFFTDFTQISRADTPVTVGIFPRIDLFAQSAGSDWIWAQTGFSEILEAVFQKVRGA